MKDSIKVMGMKYKIKKVSKKHKALNNSSGEFYAVIAHKENTIYIRDDISKGRANMTMLHEIIHAINIELMLKLSHKQIHRLAVGLSESGIRV